MQSKSQDIKIAKVYIIKRNNKDKRIFLQSNNDSKSQK